MCSNNRRQWQQKARAKACMCAACGRSWLGGDQGKRDREREAGTCIWRRRRALKFQQALQIYYPSTCRLTAMFFVRHHISIDQQGNMHDRQFMRVGVSVVAKIKFKVPAKKDSLDVNSCLYIYSVTFLSESKINSHNHAMLQLPAEAYNI
jgi:hypothetical protein